MANYYLYLHTSLPHLLRILNQSLPHLTPVLRLENAEFCEWSSGGSGVHGGVEIGEGGVEFLQLLLTTA